MSTESRRDNSPDVIQTAFAGSLADVAAPPPLKPRVARHSDIEDNDDMYEPVQVRGQMYGNTTSTGTVSTGKPTFGATTSSF